MVLAGVPWAAAKMGRNRRASKSTPLPLFFAKSLKQRTCLANSTQSLDPKGVISKVAQNKELDGDFCGREGAGRWVRKRECTRPTMALGRLCLLLKSSVAVSKERSKGIRGDCFAKRHVARVEQQVLRLHPACSMEPAGLRSG